MKSIVAVLFLLIGSGAVAQTVSPALPDTDFIESQPIRMEQMAVFGSDTNPEPPASVVAANSLVAAPSPVLTAAMTRPVAIVRSHPSSEFKTFSESKLNRTLVVTEFWSRGLDALSTHQELNSACKCYHETSHFLGLDMTPMLKNTVGAYSYSLGIAATYSFLSARLWNASKDHPRHARVLRTISRVLLMGDSSMETAADVRNFSIMGAAPSN